MGQQIIRQPNGLYCVFSDNVDDFVMVDAKPTEIIEAYVEEEKKRITAKVERIISELEAGGKPYYQFTMTFHEAVAWRKKVHRGVK